MSPPTFDLCVVTSCIYEVPEGHGCASKRASFLDSSFSSWNANLKSSSTKLPRRNFLLVRQDIDAHVKLTCTSCPVLQNPLGHLALLLQSLLMDLVWSCSRAITFRFFFLGISKERTQAGILGWSKTMIEKPRVPGSSPAWKRKEFFQPCCDPQFLGTCGLARG